jgi:hypothetical protein
MIRHLISLCAVSIALVAGCATETGEPEQTSQDDAVGTPEVETDALEAKACPPVQPIPSCWPYNTRCTTTVILGCRRRTCVCE